MLRRRNANETAVAALRCDDDVIVLFAAASAGSTLAPAAST